MIFQNRTIRFFIIFIWFVLSIWRCASTPPPPPMPEPEPEPVVMTPEPVVVVPPSPPKQITIKSVSYGINDMTIEWEKSLDPEFETYRLLQSIGTNNVPDTIFSADDVNDTIFTLDIFDPKKENWFWIDVKNTTGLHTAGERKTHKLEINAPRNSTLQIVKGNYDLKIKWSMNQDDDFGKYILYRSKNENMVKKDPVKDIIKRIDTMQVLSLDSVYYYQVYTEDVWGLESFSNIIKGDYNIEIWGKEYSLVKTTKIDLSNHKLFGSVPADFGKLFNLEVLFLQNNFLSGSLPDALWDLKKLRIINLSKNQFDGKIPIDMHKAQSLKEIWLAGNNFTGVVPYQIFTMGNITHINLSSNQLSGNISEAVANLNNLIYLNLFDNNLIGSIPEEIGECEKLEFLSLGKNQLTGAIPAGLARASKLESIALFENQLIGSIPFEILELKHLVYLGLFDNKLEGQVSNEVFKNANLSYLRLNNNRLEKVDYDSLCASGYNWDNSIYFDLSDNEFDEKIPECFSEPVFYEIYTLFKNKN
ncbi:MAG: hypothetical protein CMG55_04305 [Candidatus Marinimicrobia bacterium]|nr:hypothetical protein [Candidatus Neomarinimicrobiota bacterium]|tara:strand:- start:1688 stop:3280 length:1593 start_codon:yes stop_codon:yes gene_type:complete